MSENNVTLGLVQLNCIEDREKNTDKTVEKIRHAASRGARVVCLQELFNMPYFPREIDEKYFEWAESVPGPTTERMAALAKELEIVVLLPLFERRAAGIYHNSMAVIDADGSLMGIYRKNHIPDDPGFYEKYYFTPGDEDYRVYTTRYIRIGPMICWDQWYPEAARISALKGAELLVYPTAIGTIPGEDEKMGKEFHDAWQVIQRSHAIANGCFVAGINRVGVEDGSRFWGQSFVAGPFGQVLARAGGEEEVLTVTIDLDAIEKQRRVWPFFRDRRIDTYKPILNRFID